MISSDRMDLEELQVYVNTLKNLKERYKNRIKALIGLECEFFPRYMDWLNEIIDKNGLDYVILAPHYSEPNQY